MYTYEDDFTIQHYLNPKPNHNNGTKNIEPDNLILLCIPKVITLGLGFLDTALYLIQYSEDASCSQFGIGPVSMAISF